MEGRDTGRKVIQGKCGQLSCEPTAHTSSCLKTSLLMNAFPQNLPGKVSGRVEL